ncbi:MAG: hypothetical protein M1839_005543 [Geoglossum umbratile]|nr:MAG: hypothetical protein M1839_005543 [Geoglossum umbratile]
MSDTGVTDAALPPQTADPETPGDAELQETPQPSAKDQERSRKEKYQAAIETIREERHSLDEAGIDVAEKQRKKKELKQRKKTLDQEYKEESKRLKEEQKAQSKIEKSARRNTEQKASQDQALPTPPQPESVTEQDIVPATEHSDPAPPEPAVSQQAAQTNSTKTLQAPSSSARK